MPEFESIHGSIRSARGGPYRDPEAAKASEDRGLRVVLENLEDHALTPWARKELARLRDAGDDPGRDGQRRLLSSIRGKLESVAFSIHEDYFNPIASPVNRTASLAVFATIFEGLPSDCEIVILTSAPDQVNAWFEKLGLHNPHQILPTTQKFSAWIKDTFWPVEVETSRASPSTVYAGSAYFFRDKDDGLAEALATVLTQHAGRPIKASDFDAPLEGGNVLVDDDTWFIGYESIERASWAAIATSVSLPRVLTAAAKATYVNFETTRKPIVISTAEHPRIAGRASGQSQPIFHIDVFLSLAGAGTKEKRRVLVGSNRMAVDLLGDDYASPDPGLDPELDAIVEDLETHGFEVDRLPLPVVRRSEDPSQFYFATYNNVLVQDAPPLVIMPTYGEDGPFEALKQTDDLCARIWADLGFEVHRTASCHVFARDCGSVACLTQPLRRGP